MTGALALVAFVKLYGSVFLGQSRSPATAAEAEPGRVMLWPMALLAALCLGLGLAPGAAVRLALRAGGGWGEVEPAPAALVPAALAGLGLFAAGTLALAALGAAWLRARTRAAVARPGTWDCGYAAPSARMQYGESSLVQVLTGLFAWLIVPRRSALRLGRPFPPPSQHGTEAPDVVLDRGIVPALRGVERAVLRLRRLQKGRIQVYLLYILLALLVLLVVER